MSINIIDHTISAIVSVVSIAITVVIARKFAKRFSWTSVLLFSFMLSGALAFVIPIVLPFVTTYYLSDGSTLNTWYEYLTASDFGNIITGRLDAHSFAITVKVIINLLYLLYDFGLCIVSSFLLKKKGITVCVLWYLLNSLVLFLIPIVAIIIVLLFPIFIIYGIIIGFFTGIKNYIASLKTTY